MSTLAIAAPAAYTSATIPAPALLLRLRRRAHWCLPLVGWNAGILYLNTIQHSPVMMAIAAGSLALAAFVAVSEPDDIED